MAIAKIMLSASKGFFYSTHNKPGAGQGRNRAGHPKFDIGRTAAGLFTGRGTLDHPLDSHSPDPVVQGEGNKHRVIGGPGGPLSSMKEKV